MTDRLTVALHSARTPNDPDWFWRDWVQWGRQEGRSGDDRRRAERNQYWTKPYQNLRLRLAKKNIDLQTSEEITRKAPDVVFFVGLPKSPADVRQLAERWPHAKHILHVVESPIAAPAEHDPKNYNLFSDVVTYNEKILATCQHHANHTRFHICPLPFRNILARDLNPECIRSDGFENRKMATVLISNRAYGFQGPIRHWPVRLAGFLNGNPNHWQCSLARLWQIHRAAATKKREQIVRAFDRGVNRGDFDVFGAGWRRSDFKSSWSKLSRYSSPNSKGSFQGASAEVFSSYRFAIVVENFIGDWGYVSEKAYSCFDVGTVPIYLGEANPEFPEGTFVNARHYRTPKELVSAIRAVRPKTWHEMSIAGKAFAEQNSERVRKRFFSVVESALNNSARVV